MKSGIYQIRNTLDGKRYVGSSCNIGARLRTHKSRLKCNIHENIYLQRSWNKHGEECFVFETLKKVEEEQLLEVEQTYLNSLCEGDYNICMTAGRPPRMSGEKHPLWGKHHSVETKNKMREAKLGRYDGENHPLWGKNLSDETKGKIRKSRVERGVAVGRKNPKAKSVKQICPNTGEVVHEYSYIGQVKLHGFNERSVSMVCRGKRKTTGGYRWAYSNRGSLTFAKEGV